MKKHIILSLLAITMLTACNSKTESTLDLSGTWSSDKSAGNYQEAIISGDEIEIDWKTSDTSSLYWAGSYDAPVKNVKEYSWISKNNKEKTSTALLASQDDTKKISYKDGVISYDVSVMGMTQTMKLTKTGPVPETTASETESSSEVPTITAETAEHDTIAETDEHDEWPEITALGLDNSTMLSIYNDYESAWKSSPDDPSAEADYESQVDQEIGSNYGISPENASLVYLYVMSNYDSLMAQSGADASGIKLKHGTLLDVTTSGGTIVLKAKITSSLTKRLTTQSCFFDVYEAIQTYNLNQYDELQYWAVADMTNGSEQKVISFTITKDVLENVANGTIIENQLIDNASDVWLSPALQ
ncbi:hypothetical protein [Brotaphodocola sp.]|uniref:hypothetical protein n=1 Tax=Brotaphodocola sp. TaxID=3073577 RepID=UPI003D7DBB4F